MEKGESWTNAQGMGDDIGSIGVKDGSVEVGLERLSIASLN